MATKSDVGFVGIGEMGSRMIERLLEAGHPVAVYDADKDRQKEFARSHQVRSAETLKEVGEGVDFLITMLPDGHVVRNCYLEAEDGALAKVLKPGCIALDTSSSDPLGTRELAKELAKRGIRWAEAPVSGGIVGAEKGELVFMVGGDSPETIEKCREVLDVMGHQSFVVGGVGNGHAMKCLNNYVSSTGHLAGLEALMIGAKFGLDPSIMVDVLNESTGRNHATRLTLKQEVLSREFATMFKLSLQTKDVKIAACLAEDLALNAPLVRQVSALLLRSNETLGPGADHTETVKYYEKLNNMTLSAKK